MKRVSFSMSDELFEKINKRASDLCISRSAYVSMACVEKLRNDEAMDSLPDAVRLLSLSQKGDDNVEKV